MKNRTPKARAILNCGTGTTLSFSLPIPTTVLDVPTQHSHWKNVFFLFEELQNRASRLESLNGSPFDTIP